MSVDDDLDDAIPHLLADVVTCQSYEVENGVHIPCVVLSILLSEDGNLQHLVKKEEEEGREEEEREESHVGRQRWENRRGRMSKGKEGGKKAGMFVHVGWKVTESTANCVYISPETQSCYMASPPQLH